MKLNSALFLVSWSAALFPASSLSANDDAHVVAGWDSNNGDILLNELNCMACHHTSEQVDSELVHAKQAPTLDDVGSRVTPQYLRAYLSNPQQVKPGATMPDVLHGMSDGERTEMVESLVHFLAIQGTLIDQTASGSSLAQIEQGKSLYHSIGCVACHATNEPPPTHKIDPNARIAQEEGLTKQTASRPSVPLGDLAMKTTVESLAAFLSEPLQTRPSGRMPKFNLRPGEANFLAAYLLRDQYTDKQTAPGVGLDLALFKMQGQSMPDFDKLTPISEGTAKQLDLSAITLGSGELPQGNFALRFSGIIEVPTAGEYRFWTKSDDGSILRVDGKIVVNNDGMHSPAEKEGRIQLRRGRHVLELGFTQGGGGFELTTWWQPPGADKRAPVPAGVLLHSTAAMIPKGVIDFQPDQARAERGKQLFSSLGCSSCHQLNSVVKPQAAVELALLESDAADGCLGERVAAGRPKYALSDIQRNSLKNALLRNQRQQTPLKANEQLDHWMVTLNCYRCHARNGKGGTDAARQPYFTYEIPVDLGEEGRLPPPLNETGAKLTRDGFHDVLFKGEPYRTYMATRMPMFGEKNVGHLPGLFAKADTAKIPSHKPQFSPQMVDDGRQLAGKKRLACINCHAWGPYRLQGAEGMDFLATPRRLQPSWFHTFLADPQRLKPRTRMPTSWPQGTSFFADIQNGNVDKQIDAIWAWLSTGEKGGMPPGLSPNDDSLLIPTDEPIVFRTFLDGVSSHAICVGFRQRTHLAFDANRVRMVVAWTGNFLPTKPSWEGRAGQYAKIESNDLVHLPDGPPLAWLESLDAAWPKDLPKQKLGAKRTPPGWKFRGYRYDQRRTPTFLYDANEVQVSETPETNFRQDASVLVRRFVLKAKSDIGNLHFRAATGNKIVRDGHSFIVDDRVRYQFEATLPAAANIRRIGGDDELLVPITFAKTGGGAYQADLVVEMTW